MKSNKSENIRQITASGKCGDHEFGDNNQQMEKKNTNHHGVRIEEDEQKALDCCCEKGMLPLSCHQVKSLEW